MVLLRIPGDEDVKEVVAVEGGGGAPEGVVGAEEVLDC